MLQWAVAFLLVACLAAVLGFGGVGGYTAMISKYLFLAFIVMFLISFIAHLFRPSFVSSISREMKP